MTATLFQTADEARAELAQMGYRNVLGGCWFLKDNDGRWHQAIVEWHMGEKVVRTEPNGDRYTDYECLGYSIDSWLEDPAGNDCWEGQWAAHAARNGLPTD